jgi:xylulokinase
MRLRQCLQLVLLALVVGCILLHVQLLVSDDHTVRRVGLRGVLSGRLYLGLDLSTQSLKCTILDDQLRTVHADTLNFDESLPKWRTKGGVHKSGLHVTSPTLMWIQAIDVMFQRLKVAGLPLHSIAAVSASGQQHGSVYWADGAAGMLSRLDASLPLEEQLVGAFAVDNSPVWMDSSTSAECRERERAVGGAIALAKISGSRAFERFTGNQIQAIAHSRGLDGVERISLVSSFVASVLAGSYAGIDSSDAGGMNLMDLHTQKYDERLLAVTAPNSQSKLVELLGEIIQPHSVVGRCAWPSSLYSCTVLTIHDTPH